MTNQFEEFERKLEILREKLSGVATGVDSYVQVVLDSRETPEPQPEEPPVEEPTPEPEPELPPVVEPPKLINIPMGGKQALAVAAGGAVSENVFVNGAIGQAGNTTGAVVSGTYRWR